MANIDTFTQKLETLREHLTELRQAAPDGALPRQDLLAAAIETMNSTLEELRVAKEELRSQNDALAAAHQNTETWRLYSQDLFDSVPDAYFVTDRNGTVQEANQAAARLLGLTKRFLKGKPLATFVSGEQQRGFRDLLTRIGEQGVPVEQEVVWQPRRRLPSVESAVTVSLIRNPVGQSLSLRWVVRSVTGRSEAETERYRLLVEEVKDYAILLLDPQGCIINWNPGAEQIFGYTEAELRGRPASVIFTPEDIEKNVPELEMHHAASEGRAEDERWHRRKDGSRFWANGVMTVLRDKSGRLRWYAKVLRDFTARKVEEDRLAARYAREHHIAATLQRVLLPEPEETAIPGLSVACRYEAAWSEALVGGDFFDVLPLETGEVALFVGDVSGKGLAAAAHTAEARYTLRAYLRELPAPERALARLNAYFLDAPRLGSAEDTRFVTLCILVLDPETGQVTAAAAGAEPPLILRADGSAEPLPVSGSLLGMDRDTEYAAVSATLGPGDIILLVTDGVTEARRGREFLDYEGMIDLAQGGRNAATLGEMGQTILDGARAFAGGSLSDDACLLLARRVPEG